MVVGAVLSFAEARIIFEFYNCNLSGSHIALMINCSPILREINLEESQLNNLIPADLFSADAEMDIQEQADPKDLNNQNIETGGNDQKDRVDPQQKPTNIPVPPQNEMDEISPIFRLRECERCMVFTQMASQRKNPNFTKFLISAFNKQVKRLKQNKQIYEAHDKFLEGCKKIYEIKGKRMIKMEALRLLFGQQNDALTHLNRRILHTLMGRSDFKNYVIHNPFAKSHNIKQHLLASKVFRLRCFSKRLTGRTQTK